MQTPFLGYEIMHCANWCKAAINISAVPLWGLKCRLSGQTRRIKTQCLHKTKCRQFTTQLWHLGKELGWTYLRSNYKWRDCLFSIIEIFFLTRKHWNTKVFLFCFVNQKAEKSPKMHLFLHSWWVGWVYLQNEARTDLQNPLGSR